VTIAIGEDHLALLDTVRRFVADHCPPSVTRAVIDGHADADALRPPFWDHLAELGWLGLHLPEVVGGEGYGLAELAVVVEELGRALAPGPFLPTVWASAAVHAGGGPPELLGDLATGRSAATVAHHRCLDGRSRPDGSVVVTGTTGPVLCGGVADVVLLALSVEGAERWCVVAADRAERTVVGSLDPTRPLADLCFHEVEVAPDAQLRSLDRSTVEVLGAALAAAECAGGAAWCVETASAYAAVRRQFGRPIGAFQAVKHRCADMLVATEQTRAVAWDAALAWDADDNGVRPPAMEDRPVGPVREVEVAAAAAAAVALDAFSSVAKDCIQVLGGIGFTWEHDAHLYLRRATAMRQLLGGASRWRRATASAALGGARRRLTLALPATADRIRHDVGPDVDELADLAGQEQRGALVERGYLNPHWPPPWGRGAGAVEQLVIAEELRRARIRVPHLQVGAWAAPTIVAHGTAEQQERWVRPTLLGEISWCQLFSEPEAGSDLAALTTTATWTDGGWLLNGQKVWTTMAAQADWGICLARTNRTAPKHLGITYLIVDMASPGIDVRPLREMTGLELFNEVFLDDVFVPDDCVIGDVDGGWLLARTTLANERVTMGRGSSFGGGIESLLRLVAERIEGGLLDVDPHLLDELGALVAEAHSVATLGLRSTHRSLAGARPGPEASVGKLLGVEHDQRTQELGLALLGPEGATTVGAAGQWTFGFLANRCLTIAGGTSEIQRNVIGERLLGLPRDREPTP